MIAHLVATVLTACGIETEVEDINILGNIVATVLTACGIETFSYIAFTTSVQHSSVATVLTACGIETMPHPNR